MLLCRLLGPHDMAGGGVCVELDEDTASALQLFPTRCGVWGLGPKFRVFLPVSGCSEPMAAPLTTKAVEDSRPFISSRGRAKTWASWAQIPEFFRGSEAFRPYSNLNPPITPKTFYHVYSKPRHSSSLQGKSSSSLPPSSPSSSRFFKNASTSR